MSFLEVNRNPTHRQLRQFGAACAVALPLAGWAWGAGGAVMGVLAGFGLIAAALAWIAPKALRPVFIALSFAAAPIGFVVGEIAVLILYFGVFLPIGLVLRAVRRDPLERRIDANATTYWGALESPRETESFYRQF